MRSERASARYELKRFKYNSHYWILKILSDAKRPLRILDVGTADGYLGAILKQRGHYVVGVERNDTLAAQARGSYDRFHVADVEEFEFPYRAEFDYILFAAVLEHLKDPTPILHRALPSLKQTGEFIVSVPNVGNLAIRLALLAGRFEYADRGILDESHLRFFMLRTITNLLEQCGGRVIEVIATPVPIQLVAPFTAREIFAPLHELHFFLTRVCKRLLGYQFVIRVKCANSRSAD